MRKRSPLLMLLALCLASCSPAVKAADPPKLLVILVVDQMRADYVTRFERDWTAGLKRLVTEGAVFTKAAYPYLTTVTCAGHATIGTGAFPHRHGVFQNVWYDRDKGNVVTCTEDASVTSLVYSGSSGGGESARAMMVPSFADEMRRQRGAHVVTLALKARSAIMLAGHGGDAVSWISDRLDSWETSSAYASAPVPAVQSYAAAHPLTADLGKTWERTLPADRYTEPDAGVGENPPEGWTAVFPHPLNGTAASTPVPSTEFYEQWQRSPLADAYVGQMAAGLVDAMKLGQGNTMDVLGVSFSSPDLLGHGFGPDSQEIHDMYIRLDRTIGALLDHLDRAVGAGKYVVALSADHGVTSIPEQLTASGGDAGRVSAAAMSRAVQQAAETAMGPGSYVARVYGNDIYFRPGVWAQLQANAAALKAVTDAAAAQPGVQRVFRSDELTAASALTSEDTLLRAAALSFVPARSGDLVTSLKRGWMSAVEGTTHGSASADDQRVPVILFGSDIKAGRYEDEASPADIAPTLAAIAGIQLGTAEGRVLTSALASPPTRQ